MEFQKLNAPNEYEKLLFCYANNTNVSKKSWKSTWMQALYTAVTVLRVLALKKKEGKVSQNSVTYF